MQAAGTVAKLREKPDYGFLVPYWIHRIVILLAGMMVFFSPVNPGRILKQVNENAVKSASVIFIQTAALSHSAYYKIISIAKMNQIPVHYFSSWNARMCASMMRKVLTT